MKKTAFFFILLNLSRFDLNLYAQDLKEVVDVLDGKSKILDPVQLLENPCNANNISDENRFLISDSLVKNLSCKNLNQNNVFQSLQEDAFSDQKHLPTENWSSGVLYQCWGLSLAQRRIFYLARFSQSPNNDISKKSSYELDQLTEKLTSVSRKASKGLVEIDLLSIRNKRVQHLLAQNKNFAKEIENRQKARFFNPSNLSMTFSNWERSETTNKETMINIEKNLTNGRLPIVILRTTVTQQHALLIKKLEKLNDNEFLLTVYDSNQPMENNLKILYKDGQFHAPDIIKYAFDDRDKPVGIFLKDEDEMDEIQQIVYKYYQDMCSKIK